MGQKKINIAIDGYSGVGKSTTAQMVAHELGYTFLDSGAMYRAVTWELLNREVDLNDEDAVADSLKTMTLEIDPDPVTHNYKLYLNGKPMVEELRERNTRDHVSKVAAISAVRRFLVQQQREMGAEKGIVMDGRDIGTVVFPDAELKVFMTADLEERVQRRQQQRAEQGINELASAIRANLKMRDSMDTTRKDSPLRKARDARLLDTTHMSIEEQVKTVLKWAHEACVRQGS
ncbi:MAG: (d)CMP kinase [Bacteroidota bacterium]